MPTSVLNSGHIRIYLAVPRSAEILATEILAICDNAVVAQEDPLDQYLSIHAVAASTVNSGGEAFLKSAKKRVARWGPGRRISCKLLGHELELIITQEWVSMVFSQKITLTQAEAAVAVLLAKFEGEVVKQLHPYPTLEVLASVLKKTEE